MRCLALFRTKPFVFTENMLQSKGIEPVNQFHLLGSLSQNQLQLCSSCSFRKNAIFIIICRKRITQIFHYPQITIFDYIKNRYYFCRSLSKKL